MKLQLYSIKYFFASLFFVVSTLTSAQVVSIDKKTLEKFKNEYPQEKVFLQTDKTQYFSGDVVWMKAWCMLDGLPTYLSKILYIDIVNAKGVVVQKKMYQLDSLSSTAASFDLPQNLSSGNYSINAYTLWMLNFPEFIYSKNIYVYGTDYKITTNSNKVPKLKIHFFPEGGDIIAGVKNRVAFKVTDDNGLPLAIKGNILHSNGTTITLFETQHDGMGVFEANFEAGVNYTANIANSNGSSLEFKLPTVKDEGISMKVDNSNANRVVVLLNRAEKNKDQYNEVKLVAQINYHVVFTANLNIDEGQTAAPITKKNLPPGILHITLFNNKNIPIAERLVFVENYAIEKPTVKLENISLKARAKNRISFSLDSSKNALSVAVTATLNESDGALENNIASSFLVTTDLKGFISNPGYYFKNKDAITLRHLDLLLMTQGWRRFDWKKITQNQYAQIQYPVESSIVIRGKLTKSDRTVAVKEGHVAFVIRGEDSTRIMADASVTDKGEFLLSDLNFKKKASIAYQGTNSKKEKLIVDVKLDPSYIDSLSKSNNSALVNLDTTNINDRENAWANFLYGSIKKDTTPFQGKDLGNVTVKAKRLSKVDSLNNVYATGPFAMGTSVVPDDYKYAISIWQMLQQAVPGLTVEGNPFDPTVFFNRFKGLNALSDNTSSSTSISNSNGDVSVDIVTQTSGIAFFINEINVSKDVVNSLSVDDVALIKVLKNEGGSLGATEGVIAIYTKKGGPVNFNPYEKTFTVIERSGYAIVRQFFAPDYEQDPNLDKNITDKRFTVYWNGNIKPAKDGKYRFQFFNNDISNNLKLIIQGIDADGQFIYTEQILQ